MMAVFLAAVLWDPAVLAFHCTTAAVMTVLSIFRAAMMAVLWVALTAVL